MSETNKYLGELATQQMVQEIKDGFSPIGHAHTASDVGADQIGSAAAALSLAKEYTNTEVNKAQETLQASVDSKADEEHTHVVADVTNLQTVLDGKADQSHGTHVTYSSTTPVMDGTANVGSANTVARSDHRHPTDTTRASQADLDALTETLETHTGNSTIHVTSTNKTQWNSAYSHSTSAHAPSNAEKNVIVGIQRNGTDLTVNSSTRKVNITVPTTASDVGADPSGSASSALNSAKAYTNEQITNVQADIDGHIDDSSVHITSAERTKLSGIAAGAQVNTITGVKGNSETSYRTGNVNITPANIGLGNVNNTSDANKPVSTAQQTAIDVALESANSYTDTKTASLASTTVVDNKISSHNSSTSAHSDIRELITGLTTRLNTLADSDDTTLDQMSEVVAYIKSNKSLIDSITTSKINVSDIVDNLTTSSVSKVLSAKQGVAIKTLINDLQAAVDGKSDVGHTHNYAGSSSAGGAAISANKVNKSLTVKLNSGATEGTNLFTFDGSTAKSINITPSVIGASASSHTHDDRYYTETEVDTIAEGKSNVGHKHTVSHTPAGSVSKPSFSGTKATISASYTPAGTVSKPTFTGSAVDSGGASDTTTVYSITAVGTLPSHSYTAPTHSYTAPSLSASVANRCLTLSFSAGSHSFNAGSHSFSAGTLPTKGSGVAVATGAHIHTVTPAGTVSQPSFTGTEATISAEYTPAGTVSQPSFTGTAATLTTSVDKDN